MFFNRKLRDTLFASVSAGTLAAASSALGNPLDPTVVTGDVTISGTGTDHVIIQNDSMRSVVDWDSFSIGAGETTSINQITNEAAILNRVTGGDISEIYGTLESNGQVYLINENGILIGESGLVDTGGFVASTLNVSNADFLGAGDMLFSQGIETGGGITVHGTIRSVTGGDIFLLSREIEVGETGRIETDGGYVGLGAGEEILLRPVDSGDGRISIRAGKGKIVNRGHVEAAAAELRAAGGNEYALAINNTGVVRATGVSKKGGRIMLTGGGKVRNTGRVVARKKVVVRSTRKIVNRGVVKAGTPQKGGEIIFEAPEISVEAGSVLDVSGALGGGRMFIGGGFQGSGTDRGGNAVDISQNAEIVTVEAGALLDASASASGDAGQVIIWSDDTTTFAGDIVATSVDGTGGFAEVSGKDTLSFLGTADLRSENGQFGTLLLDPGGLTVSTAASGGNNLNDTDVETALGFANVVITTVGASTGLDTDNADTDNDNTTGQDVTASDAGTGDVDFLAGVDIQWTADTLLEVNAERDINALDDVIIQHSTDGTVTGTDGVRFLAAGDINIGSAAGRTDDVAIGSAFGQTTMVAGDSDFDGVVDLATGSVNVLGGDASPSIAQIGFNQGSARGDSGAADNNGDIRVEAGDAVNLTGGTGPTASTALIGHGGRQSATDVAAIVGSDITVVAGAGGVNLASNGYSGIRGFDTGSAQIGHGSVASRGSASSMGDISGNISVSTRAGTDGDVAINDADPITVNLGVDHAAAARIGHGALATQSSGANSAGYTQGRIAGDISVTADGDLVMGFDLARDAADGVVTVISQIGHGALVHGNILSVATTTAPLEFTFGDIRDFNDLAETDGDENTDSTSITVMADSVLVQANSASTDNSDAAPDDDIVNNFQRTQIGHGSFVQSSESDQGANDDAPIDIVITENRIAGDIAVYDTDRDDDNGVTVSASVTEGDAPLTSFDVNIARIGHGTGSIIGTQDGGVDTSGAVETAFRGGNVTIYQAHILGADILVDTQTQGTVDTADDAHEVHNQDITVESLIAAGNAAVTDNSVNAQIGHGGEIYARTGDGADAVQDVDGDAADGGDITIYKGTVWDGGLERDDDADSDDDISITNTTNIALLSSNEVILESTSTSGLAVSERNSGESQVGHGHRILVVTGDGGVGGNTGRDGGAGGDILIIQSLDAREYGLDQGNGTGEFDDYAYGLRGDISVTARESDETDGANALTIETNDSSANTAANNSSDYAMLGHSDVIELVSGDGGAGGGLGAGGADNTDDPGDNDADDPNGQVTAFGGRGGHIDVQLGRLAYDQGLVLTNRTLANGVNADVVNSADLGDNRNGAVLLSGNAQAENRLQGVQLVEGDITVNAIGRVVLDSSATNGLSANNRSITESVIGHGQRIFADSGDGGAGGDANFYANDLPVYQSETEGEQFLNYRSGVGAVRGGNGGDIRLTFGDITDREIADRISGGQAEIYHDTDADRREDARIALNISDTFAVDINGDPNPGTVVAAISDSLVITTRVDTGTAEGTGNDVFAGVGHRVRMQGEGGSGGDGGSANTEFDDDRNSLFVNGGGQSDSQGAPTSEDGVDETALQAGAVDIQPNSSGGRGGDVLIASNNINGDIVVVADRRVTVETTASHGEHTYVISTIGHSTSLVALTQNGGTAGLLYEPSTTGTTFDGGIINVNGTQTGANDGASSFDHVLIDGDQDDSFEQSGLGDSDSIEGEDGIAVTPDDIANRQGSTIQSINSDLGSYSPTNTGAANGDGTNSDGIRTYLPDGPDSVIFHDEEADPEFILDNDGTFVLNDESNNDLYSDNAGNLARFGRVVATYDQHDPDTDNELNGTTGSQNLFDARFATTHADRRALQVFVDMDRDGDVDLVDFDRDGRLDIVDVDNDGFMDVIDGRANYVDSGSYVQAGDGTVNGITGLGVLDYVAVTGRGFEADGVSSWSIQRELNTTDLISQYNGGSDTHFTALVGDFSMANGGRGGDAYTQAGYSIGDISVSTGNNDNGEAESLVVHANLDDYTPGGGDDYHRANIGHSAVQWSDAGGLFIPKRAGREGLSGAFDAHVAADGGNAENFAVNASGGRGGVGFVRQGQLRDVDPDVDGGDTVELEADHLVGHIYINTPNALDNSVSNDAKRVDILSTVDLDYGDNIALASLGHQASASATGGGGGNGASSPGGEDGSSQTEIANGGNGGDTRVLQNQIKGGIWLMTGADDEEPGTPDFSVVMLAENGSATNAGSSDNTIVSQIGHGRIAASISGSAGDGDDGQYKGNGGDGGDALIQQDAILDTYISVDLVQFDAVSGTGDTDGYFGNGMQITANLFENSNSIVRAQVGHGDLAYAESGDGGDGSPDWNVNEQRNQTANGGDGGDARIVQTGYAYDIFIEAGHNKDTDGNAFELISSSANINVGSDNFVLASVGHGGMAEAVTGAGGDGGLSGSTNGLQTLDDPNLVDADYNYNGPTDDGDTPYDIDEDENRLTLGTDRRGGHGGNAHVVINHQGTGRDIEGRDTDNDYGRDDTNGADITVQTRDVFDAGQMASAGYDGILVRSVAGPGSNQDHALYANTALIGHHGFAHADASDATGGDGIQSGLSATISEGDGGDGGSAITQIGQVWGDVSITNVGNPAPAGDLDSAAADTATDIVFEAIGGTPSDSGDHRAEARAGHLTHASAFAGDGGNSSREAGSPPSFPATISAQGGDGGDALTWQGQLAGDISLRAENSITVQALDGVNAENMTVAALGHRMEGRALAGDGAFGGTYAGDSNAQSVYFTYEALREFHARGSDSAAYTQMSGLEKKLIDPVLDYFENKPGELEVFLDRLVGDDADEIAANRRSPDETFFGTSTDNDGHNTLEPGEEITDYSVAPLVDGSGHMGGDSNADDGEIETLSAILAASGHGGNAAVVQGSVGLDGVFTDELAASGNVSLTAYAYDTSDADRGITILGHSNALADTVQIAHVGHQAEAYKVRGGTGWNVDGRNAGANGIGGDGGDAMVDQYALNGGIDFDSRHKLVIAARDTSLAADETRAWVGHRLTIGPDNDGYREDPVVEAGEGGSEQSVPYADGHNGNGGDVFIWQRGVISGTQRPDSDPTEDYFYDTEIQLSALQDADDHQSILIEAVASALSAPDVETHIGHDFLIHSVKAGDAGRQASLSGPNGAAEGLLEGNGGDIFIYQSDLGADIDIVGRDDVDVLATSSNSNWAHLNIGHERTVGLGVDHDNPRADATASIVAGLGGDAVPEDINDTDLASIDAAAAGIIEDGDSGRIEIVLGVIGDSWEDADDNNADDDERLITITSIQEDLSVIAMTANGTTSIIEIGNQQQVHAETGSASEYNSTPYTQPAGDAGGVYIARDDIYGDILLQAIDADRANSENPTDGKVVEIHTQTGLGALAEVKIGHETWFDVLTSNPDTVRSAWGRDREFLFAVNLADFGALIDPTTVDNDAAGQATYADAQNAVEDMEDVVRMLEYVITQYGDRFPADDGVADGDDLGDLNTLLADAQTALNNALAALNSVDASDLEDVNNGSPTNADSVEAVVRDVQQAANSIVGAATAFETILDNVNTQVTGVPNADELLADPAKAGDIVYGGMTARVHNIASLRTFEPVADRNVMFLDDHDATVLQPLNDMGAAPFDPGLLAQGGDVSDTGVVRGDIWALSGRDTDLTGITLTDRGDVIGNDTIVATNFGGTGFTAADDIDDGVVKITTLTSNGETLTELGHRRFMSNVTSFGGGDTNGGTDDGGIMGDGGSITTRNTTGGDITVRAEEVVIHANGGPGGTGEVHLLHSALTMNYATGWSDIQTRMGSGGDISNNTLVYGGLDLDAERIATDIDAQDRTLQANGLANEFIHFGHQVADDNLSNSDPVEPVPQGDSQDNLGSNRGGSISSVQRVFGQRIVNGTTTYGDVVNIGLDVNGDGMVSDLIIETLGAGQSDIRLGHGEDEDTLAASVFHRGVSGGQPAAPRSGGFADPDAPLVASGGVSITDDGDWVTLTQEVDGDIRISQVEDLEIKALGAADNDIWIGHDAEQFGQSGQVNNPPSVLQYGERVTVTQTVMGTLDIQATSSFFGQLGGAAGNDWHLGHEATQTAFSADDSADPSDFEDDDANGVADGNGASAGAVNDDFDQPDILASQLIQSEISIVTGEITLQNDKGADSQLQVGHEAFHIASVDGDKTHAATDVNSPDRSTGHVVATSRINPGDATNDEDDIILTATGATGQTDTVVVAVNGTEGDIQIINTAVGETRVGHRSTSTMTDGLLNAEGQYSTLQAIGNSADTDSNGEVDDTSQAVIALNAVQDIVVDNQAAGRAQVGHFITEEGTLQTNPVDVDDDISTGPAADHGDSQLRQIIGSDVLIGSNASQGSGGTGTGGAGNNFVLSAGSGDALIGHNSPDSNQWQVEGMAPDARRVTVQLLDGDITVEAGTDADADAPDGTVLASAAAAIADETGTGDDFLIITGTGEARIGHDQANTPGGAGNRTQASAGDIWARAGGDMHVLGGAGTSAIGHEDYNFDDSSANAAAPHSALPESLGTVRDRIRGNTTVGAGQNSAPEDSTLIADIMVFDAQGGAVDINSGYGGQGDADVDGELRFFLPAQEGLTIVSPVRFNDSVSNTDMTFDRTGDPSNVFEGQGGNDHEHDFTFMSETAPYTDQYIGLGNFTFYFESTPQEGFTYFPEYTPYINLIDLDPGFAVVLDREGGSKGQGTVNIGNLEGKNYLGTSSFDIACEEDSFGSTADVDEERLQEECERVVISHQGSPTGFGSNWGFSATAGGNQTFGHGLPDDLEEVSANGSFGYTVPVSGELRQPTLITPQRLTANQNAYGVTTAQHRLPAWQSGALYETAQAEPLMTSAYAPVIGGSMSEAEISYAPGDSYGEYITGESIYREMQQANYPDAISYASSYTVFVQRPL